VSEVDDLRRENERLRKKVEELESEKGYVFDPRRKMREQRRDAAEIAEERRAGRHLDGE
jgi:hypothetical protein